MLRPMPLILAMIFATLSPLSIAHAQETVSLTGDVKVVRTVEDNGVTRDVVEEPAKVVPGDHLVFSTSYSNDTGQPVDAFVITNPLPEGIALARDGDFEVSIDGGKSWGSLAMLSIRDDAGATRQATLDDVTQIRWILPRLAVGAAGTVSYSAVVR